MLSRIKYRGLKIMIYVDKLFTLGGRRWCHMYSDGNIEELHEMADRIGLKREWFQNKPECPHYDLSPSKRALAIRNGAVSCEPSILVREIRKRRLELAKINDDNSS